MNALSFMNPLANIADEFAAAALSRPQAEVRQMDADSQGAAAGCLPGSSPFQPT